MPFRSVLDKGGEMILLNAVEDAPGYIAAELPANIYTQKLDEAQERLEALARANNVTARVEVRKGRNPAASILDEAEESSCDLVMIASHRPGLQDYFLGSTAGRVVRHAQCSVLVMR
ncbi:MAG: universal stress protein [Roseovarius sp.]